MVSHTTEWKNKVFVTNDNSDAVQFAQQVATIKNIQTDLRPFYVMNVGCVDELLNLWFKCLPRVQLYYSINCNNDAVLLQVLTKHSFVGLFCQTKRDIEQAMEYVEPKKILYSNACWTRSAINDAYLNNIGTLAFESVRDLQRIAANYSGCDLLLNVCVNKDSEDVNAQMGCSLEEAPELLQMCADMCLNCVGVAFNIGAVCTSPRQYAKGIEQVASLFDFGRQIGLQMRVLNIGGGFSSRTETDDNSFYEICEQLNKALDFYFPVEYNNQLQIIATPGRFIAEPAFSLITNVIGRRSVDASCVTNDDFDAGTEAFIYQTNEGYYGSFGCQIDGKCRPQCLPLFDDKFSSEHVYGSVLGPTLDEQFDVVQSLCRFRPLRVGEWLIWSNMGAYTLNNCHDLDGEDKSSYPSVFYFALQNEWTRLHQQRRNSRYLDGEDDISVTMSDDESIGTPYEDINGGYESKDFLFGFEHYF